MSIDRGYRPSSALQALFSVYHGTFKVCLQNLMLTCLIVLLSIENVSYKIIVLVPIFHNRKVVQV